MVIIEIFMSIVFGQLMIGKFAFSYIENQLPYHLQAIEVKSEKGKKAKSSY